MELEMNSEIEDKINHLFSESESERDVFNNIIANDSKFNMEDFSEDEKKEVQQYLKSLQQKLPQKPRKVWKWSFWGRIILKTFIYLLEFMVLCAVFTFILPFSINIDVSISQGIGLGIITAYLKYWFN